MDCSCDVDRFGEGVASLEIVELIDTGGLENAATSSFSFFIGGINGKFEAIEDDTGVSSFMIFEVFNGIRDFELQAEALRLCPI